MKSIASLFIVLSCYLTSYGEPPGDDAEAPVRTLFACQIYSGLPGVKVIETAEDYAAARKSIMEITWPEEGVRRAGSKMLRELGDVDLTRTRVVLIWNASMANEIRLLTADADEIRVQNVGTGLNALQGSAQLVAVAVPRAAEPPRVTWVGKTPKAPVGGPPNGLPPPPEDTSP